MAYKPKKVKGGYKSSSGRKYTKRQIRAYYATKGFKRGVKRKKK